MTEKPKPRDLIRMSHDEVDAFIKTGRTALLATQGPRGWPHVVPMWFGYFDGNIWFEAHSKSQKVLNVRRDNRVTVTLERGDTYDQLRGISIDGEAEIVDDPETLWRIGVSEWERYHGPYHDGLRSEIESMLHRRVGIQVRPIKIRSWDHRKLNLPRSEVAGSTAPETHEARS
ncbi:pyridoxamine 5'-phosphate oxidase family protein [Dactylosporangium sp. CA-233914]|uniref:pyridoxamine 5'-phosphate oxidase family protein n=1 Tax=Dactylosporangium sp. CA-233914 TaxID=3239934 RepID=UPI003D8CAB41